MLKRLLNKSEYFRNILILSSGTAIAQLIPILISPVLTRLYSPDSFGVFALYYSASALMSTFPTLRYSAAIIVPKDEDKAKSLLQICIITSIIIGGIYMVLFLLFIEYFSKLFFEGSIYTIFYTLPLSAVLTGLYLSLYNWHNRFKSYKIMAKCRLIRASTIAIFSILCGVLLNESFTYLIIALLGGHFTGIIYLWIKLRNETRRELFKNINKLSKTAKEYKNYPLYFQPGYFISTSSGNLPNIFFNAYFGPAVVGFYDLTNRVLNAPAMFLATSIQEVFRQRAIQDFNNKGNCLTIFWKTFALMLLISIPPFAILYIYSPEIFSFVFGSEWRISGEYARIVIPYIMIRLIVSPICCQLLFPEKAKRYFIWSVILFIGIFYILIIGKENADIITSLQQLTIYYSIMYIAYFIMNFFLARGNKQVIT